MALLALCSDTGWEIVYGFIFPEASRHFGSGVRVWLLLHVPVVYVMLKFGADEWDHNPLVKKNLPLVYVALTFGFGAAQMALANEIGPDLGFFFGGVFCQTLLIFSHLCQLLSRGSTRGASYSIWFFRCVGFIAGFSKLILLDLHGHNEVPWLGSPICWFYMAASVVLDIIYPVCLYFMRREEQSGEQRKNKVD
ncbi:hypothetical protein BJX65DRAFT_315384 [Aspergillus insuetus]